MASRPESSSSVCATVWGCPLPGFSTLNEIAARVRAEVNAGMFSGIFARMTQLEVLQTDRLLGVGLSGKSEFDALKRAAGKASWSNFRGQVAHMRWVDSLGDSRRWLEGIAESQIADFAGEALAADAAVMGDVSQPKRTALLACLVHVAQTRARDELADMFCKRMAVITKRARAELDELRERAREISERLIEHYREVLGRLDPRSAAGDAERALLLARATVERAGGFEAELEAEQAGEQEPLAAGRVRQPGVYPNASSLTITADPGGSGIVSSEVGD